MVVRTCLFCRPFRKGKASCCLKRKRAGKPVVAFDIGGVNEAVKNGETGLLVERGNSGELADALLKLLGDSEFAFEDGFGWSQVCNGKFHVGHMRPKNASSLP